MEDDYILLDCPGQVELFTHHNSLKQIFKQLEKLDYRVNISAPNSFLIEAGGCESRRFVLLYRPCFVCLGTGPLSQDYAANGISIHKCPNKDRFIEPIWSTW